MTHVDPESVTRILQEVAAEFILPRFRNLKSDDVGYKIGDDPVTIADKEAEIALTARLSGLLQGSKVVGEEAYAANPSILSLFSGESPVWIIDPIDGTRNFVKGSSEFGVIIALAKQNQTVAGWIYDPSSNEVLTTEKGSGAWFKGKKLKVLAPSALSDMHGFMGERFFIDYKKLNPINQIPPVFHPLVASAHEYPRLVLNEPHFGKDKPQTHFYATKIHSNAWDHAAGVLIHQESGGYSAYWDGSPYQPSYMERGLALAPDKDSWQELKAWCQTFTDLPMNTPT